MSASNQTKNRTGFSTGALEKGNYRKAIDWMGEHGIKTIELSALRFDELEPLVNDLNQMNLDDFDWVSFHAPSSFSPEQEVQVIQLLQPVFKRGWNIIVHPDVLYTPSKWRKFGNQLLIENMDRRKSTGRNVAELKGWFQELPEAKLCLDVAHARQLDSSLHTLGSILHSFHDRIAEIHISELDARCKHHPLSRLSINDYKKLASSYPTNIPIIIESMLDGSKESIRMEEYQLASTACSV